MSSVVAEFESAFPGQVRSYYLLGSYADDSAVPLLSDINMLIIFKDVMLAAQEISVQQIVQACAARSPVRLDLVIRGESELSKLHSILQRSLKSGSRLLRGEDLRPSLPEIPLEPYRRAAWDGALHFILPVLRGVQCSDLPLNYPDPGGEFFGYDRIKILEWYPPEFKGGTKELVAAVSRLCSALLARHTGVQASGKAEAFRLYPELVGGEWAPLVRAIFEECKLGWHYRVPAGSKDRARLRLLCERTLQFENYALEQCRRYFEELLLSGNPATREEAEMRLKRLASDHTV